MKLVEQGLVVAGHDRRFVDSEVMNTLIQCLASYESNTTTYDFRKSSKPFAFRDCSLAEK
jgi:hypothetical protein